MINILSYIGMNVRSEVCLWTLLGLVRTIFDATLFRVNANLKQVWQMTMPDELSMSVQRVLRTMISGVILIQCFTVYIYLASYIVLLYPVFLEERPTLVLPWLLLAAVRKLLCELMSLALGLGTCVLLGPARPPCIKFLIIKVISIMPSFYMWMLLFSYYHSLKISAAFKKFPAVLPAGDSDYGLELAIRRRRTKSLLGEAQLRSKIVASLYGEQNSVNEVNAKISKMAINSRMMHSTDTNSIDGGKIEGLQPSSFSSNRISENGSYEDWFGSEVVLPRSCDRILEQFVLMLLRIKVYLDKDGMQVFNSQLLNGKLSATTPSAPGTLNYDEMHCTSMASDDTDTPFQVGTSRCANTSSYLKEYPQIFMKKSADVSRDENNVDPVTIPNRQDSDSYSKEDNNSTKWTRKRTVTVSSKETILFEEEKVVTQRKYIPDEKSRRERKLSSTSTEIASSSKEITVKDLDGSIIHTSKQNGNTDDESECISCDKEHKSNEEIPNDENVDTTNIQQFVIPLITEYESSSKISSKNNKEIEDDKKNK